MPTPRSTLLDQLDRTGFYGLKLDVVSNYPKHFLTCPEAQPGDPVFVARKRMDAPYPDVEFVLPVTRQAAEAHLRGDASVAAALVDELVALYGRFRREHGIV